MYIFCNIYLLQFGKKYNAYYKVFNSFASECTYLAQKSFDAHFLISAR